MFFEIFDDESWYVDKTKYLMKDFNFFLYHAYSYLWCNSIKEITLLI